MNLVVCKDNMVHCTDILDALTKNFLGTSDGVDAVVPLEDLKKGKPSNYEPIGTTLQLQREAYCAVKITRTLRRYLDRIKEKRIEHEKTTAKTASCDVNLTPISSPRVTPFKIKKEISRSNLTETFL